MSDKCIQTVSEKAASNDFDEGFQVRTSGYLLVACGFLLTLSRAFAQPQAQPDLLANPIFQKNCVKCHGKTGEGRHFGGPSLVDAKVTGASNDELLNIITNGKGHMPKYSGKLTPDEISDLAKQIKMLGQK